MARILILFLMILTINKQVTTFSILGIDLSDIKNIYNYVNTLYGKGMEYANKDQIEKNDPNQQLKQIMSELREMSKQLTNFVTHQDEKMDRVVKVLLNNIEVIGDVRSVRNEFVQHISNVEYWFQQGELYQTDDEYSTTTLKNYIKSVLWSPNNLDHLLFDIYKLIFPGTYDNVRKNFLTLTLENAEASYERSCDKYISSQQQFYYIFMILIRTQLRGFTTVTQAYTMQTVFDHVNYTHEYKIFKQTFYQRLTNYFESFIHLMPRFPSDIRACDIAEPIIGKNVFEMEGVFQVIYGNEFSIKQAIYNQLTTACGSCEEIYNHTRMQYMIYNCKSFRSIQGCPIDDYPNGLYGVRFSSLTADSETFGRPQHCDRNLYDLSRYISPEVCWVDLCICSVNTTEKTNFPDKIFDIILAPPKIKKISMEPQLSNIKNNMVVVGVKFILHDNAIHLQIQQSKIAKCWGFVNDSVWKPVNVDDNNNTMKINYTIMYDERSIFYLDDVLAQPNHVVTGVKLDITKDGKGFELHVHATEYDYKSGQLGRQMWYGPGDYPVNHNDYQRKRIEIDLNDPDDPIMAHDYHPDPESNKFVQFQHSSIKKDAGSHTVPFFDGQMVETQVKFPLSGIGLFYRQRDGYGGYIAPRLITYNVSLTIESSYNNWKQLENMYKKCGLDVPANVTEFKGPVDCKILQQRATKLSKVPIPNINQINQSDKDHYGKIKNDKNEKYTHDIKTKVNDKITTGSEDTLQFKEYSYVRNDTITPSIILV